jgi:hypothetical protein
MCGDAAEADTFAHRMASLDERRVSMPPARLGAILGGTLLFPKSLDGVRRGYAPAAQAHGGSFARDQFEGDGLCPALLVALSYQFFHDIQSPACITSQCVPTPLPERGLGISPHNLQASHTAAPTETGVSLSAKMDFPVCFHGEYPPERIGDSVAGVTPLDAGTWPGRGGATRSPRDR